MTNLAKRIELLANVAIIIVALLLGVVLVKRYLLPQEQPPAARSQIQPGTKLSLPGVDWGKSDRTLLMVISTDCRFCTESAPFYQRLAQEKAKRGRGSIVAVLPQGADEAKKYLDDHGIAVDEIKQAIPGAVGARGTPTLVLVDRKGSVVEAWVGKLPLAQESGVLNRFFANDLTE
jgi:thioredoxin-related protein